MDKKWVLANHHQTPYAQELSRRTAEACHKPCTMEWFIWVSTADKKGAVLQRAAPVSLRILEGDKRIFEVLKKFIIKSRFENF